MKKRHLSWIDIIFWLIIIISGIIEFRNALATGDINITFGFDTSINMLGIKEWLIIIASSLFSLFFCTILAFFKCFPLVALYIGLKIARKKYNREKLEKIDFKNDNYYREIISKYSPGVLSYIDDFTVAEEDVVATVMSLELKQKIKIENKIEIINEDEDGLEENEKYIFKNIKNNTFYNVNLVDFQTKVVRDCIKSKLLEENTNLKKNIIKKILISICIEILLICSFFGLGYLFDGKQLTDLGALLWMIVMTIILVSMFFWPPIGFVYINSYFSMNKSNPFIRNKKAKAINIKLEGLKKYIKDYSLLDKKNYQNIAIWKNYLIYSVIFGQNTKIVDDTMKILKSGW